MSVLQIRARQPRERTTVAATPTSPSRSEPIVTWAEQAECTCPEHCDRDHEQD
jgi:hypothetical protein